MITKINSSFTFKGVTIQDGGLDYLKTQEGEVAVTKAQDAQKLFENSKWKLNISKDGYALKSPSTCKTYSGPFTVKKQFKTGAKREDTTALIVRMDKLNRIRYIIHFPDMKEVSKVYKAIKNSKGLDKMLLLLAVLEKHI